MNDKIKDLKKALASVIVGKDETIDLILTAMLAGGHVLLEDMPGTGKTLLAKTLAKCLDASFSRIQFTPDLLPSDITGLHVYQPQTGEFVLKKGPVFAQVVLADEINRATPRTQAALLEGMEEHQVTLDGESLKLAEPFFVIATQNPIETSGTFPLPEAQLDRFYMKLSMGRLSAEEELAMVERFENNQPLETVGRVLDTDELKAIQQEVNEVSIHPVLKKYIVELCQTSRSTPKVLCGASPRATLKFVACAKAYAYIQGRSYVQPEDIQLLAEPVLAHRLTVASELKRNGGANSAVQHIVKSVAVPTEDWRA